jgi:hypothetical protein
MRYKNLVAIEAIALDYLKPGRQNGIHGYYKQSGN